MHRDGAWTAAQMLGTLQYVSVIVGTWNDEDYNDQHRFVLTTLLESLTVDYIVGTCSPVAQVEPPIADEFQTILLAQVQTSSFYVSGNSYVFGIPLNSDLYAMQYIQALALKTSMETPIHVIYPTTPDWYSSTCLAAYQFLLDRGFTNVQRYSYETPSEVPTLGQQICSNSEHPILMVCVEDFTAGTTTVPCPPSSIWMPHPPPLPFLVGAVQGHEHLPFQDDYFESTQAFWDYIKLQFDYVGNYDQVVSYAIPHLAAQHYDHHASLQSTLQLHETLIGFSTDTLMGPIRFDASRRNVGRECVTIQWGTNLKSVPVAPLLYARGVLQLTAPSAVPCSAGHFWDLEQARTVLESACIPCPVNTYLAEESQFTECIPCPTDTTTMGEQGQLYCMGVNDTSVSDQVLMIGYFAIALSWVASMVVLVRSVQQKDLTALLCLGSVLSTSAFLAWSLQACEAVPFLYVIGWILQAWSLTTFRRWEGVILIVDLALVISWTLINPLVVRILNAPWDMYVRLVLNSFGFFLKFEVEQSETSLNDGVLILEVIGQCRSQDPEGPSAWLFGGLILGVHAVWILVLIVLICQTSPFPTVPGAIIASGVMLENILIGVPVLLAVQDSPTGIHIVLMIFICAHDIILLALSFVPHLFKKVKDDSPPDVRDPQRSHRTRSLRMKRQPTSQWDQAVSTIDDLLNETANISDDHKEQLESIKLLLAQHGDSKSDQMLHLPLHLIRKGLMEAVKTGVNQSMHAVKAVHSLSSLTMSKPVNQISETARFILKEFGGVNTTSAADVVKVRAGSIISDDFDNDQLEYVLPEFMALSRENQMRLFRLLSWSSLKRWEFNVFDVLDLTEGRNPLLFLGWAILGAPHAQYSMARQCGVMLELSELRGYNFADEALRIPMEHLCDYLRVIEQDYKESNPYHNQIHAADVVQTIHTLIQMIGDSFPTNKVDIFSILLAAVVHDVKHPGENNSFQANARTDLALLYNDTSILENRHIAHAFQVMLGGEDNHAWRSPARRLSHINHGQVSSLNPLCNVDTEQLKSIRSKMIDAVLHTDMSKHFASVNSMKAIVMSHTEKGEMDEETSWKILCFMLHLADISNPAKPDPLCKLWADRCLEEFFAQGDKEKELGLPVSPNCDRQSTKKAACQLGFITYVVSPAYEVLARILDPVEDRILPIIQNNTDFWKSEDEKCVSEGESTTEQ